MTYNLNIAKISGGEIAPDYFDNDSCDFVVKDYEVFNIKIQQ